MKKQPKIALALGGGGALGFAHVGAIQVLQEHNIPIHLIVGTSMGAIVGGAIACGRTPQEIATIAEELRTHHLYDFNIDFKGFLSGRRVLKFLKREIPDIQMQDTKIPFICNAVDLCSGKEVVLKDGNIINNIRASMSVPGVFTPVKKDDMLLVDGGVISNIPDKIAKDEGADIIIAVDVVTNTICEMKKNNIISCMIQSALIVQKELQKHKKQYSDIIIQPNLGNYKQYDFTGELAVEIIEQGRMATLNKIDEIKKLIKKFK